MKANSIKKVGCLVIFYFILVPIPIPFKVTTDSGGY